MWLSSVTRSILWTALLQVRVIKINLWLKVNENIADLDKKVVIDEKNDEEADEGESGLVSTEVLPSKYLEVDQLEMRELAPSNSGPDDLEEVVTKTD